MNDRLIRYGEDRALEHVAYALGATPTRIVKLLLPVHRVEIQATVTEAKPYALIDRHVEHGIAEGRLQSVAELAGFYFLDENLVDRAVRFLVAIGHIQESGGLLSLTELGYRSVRDDVRYEVRHRDRRALYFDGFGSRPLSRRYYGSRRVTFLAATDPHGWFKPVMSTHAFRDGALAELLRNPERDRYNLPGRVDDLEKLDSGIVFLPAYVVRALQRDHVRYVVYTQIGDEQDAEITAMYERSPEISSLLEIEQDATEGGLNLARARRWLADNDLGEYEPARRADGTWQIVLPAAAFGENGVSVAKLGSFILLGSDIIHVWCPDETLRHQALLKRMDDYLAPRARVDATDVEDRLSRLTRQLELSPIDIPSLRHIAVNAGREGLAAQLSRLC
jgi:hypothetical protein